MKARPWLLRAAAPAAAVAAALAVAWPASATTGPKLYASCATNDGNACAGEVATGAAFQSVTASAVTRDPNQYAAITNGIGWQVGLKATTGNLNDAIIGISDASPNNGAGYSPQSLMYENGAIVAVAPNALWCAVNNPCAPASQGGAFPVGQNVTLAVSYNKAEGVVHFSAWDNGGDFYEAFYRVGHAVAFSQARLEAGYGSFTAPSAATKLVQFSGARFTNTAGARLNFRSTGITRQLEYGTSDGTSTGTVQAGPGTLNKAGTGFPVNFLP